MRRFFFCLYLLACVFTIFLGMEGVLRLVNYVPDGVSSIRFYSGVHGDLEPRQHVRDVDLPNLPYQVTATSEGTRGLKSFTVQKPEGVIRVLCLGDSFTYGYGVDDRHTYPELLLHELERRYPDRKFEVINSGIPLFGILDEMDYFIQKGAALKPDLVVLQFFTNDVGDMTRATVFRENMANDIVYSHRGWLSKLLGWSRLYQVAEYTRVPFLKKFAAPVAIGQPPRGKVVPNSGLDPYRFQASKEEHVYAGKAENILGPESDRELSRVWRAYGKALAGLRDMVRANGADLLFVLTPDILEMENGGYYADHQELAPMVNALGIPAVDMLEPFRQSRYIQYINPYLAPRDGHCSPHGNSLVARAVATSLRVENAPAAPSPLRIEPGEPLPSLAGSMTMDMHITPTGPIAFGACAGLSATVASSSGWRVLKGEETHLDSLLADDGRGGRAEIVLAFHADTPLSRVEMRLPCSVKPAPGLRSSLSVEFSLDGRRWDSLLRHETEDPIGGSGFEQYVILDKRILDASDRDFQLRIRMTGKAMLYTERPDKVKRSRIMTVTGFPCE